ncbi:carbon storage regulator [Jeongeupia chitinilytica]|uniref:Uncharacterized protein n=1 Tax=Jeongeupia chitinilytica TaxID=1041641 RepID=A0ABQ3H4E9_9NEIS|nr:carbon storage regulator [Jeongeupia chitinilytica]GHD66480.1 hypothetical protein GCM10007350_28760 [Jeongeupia chitinilytica]
MKATTTIAVLWVLMAASSTWAAAPEDGLQAGTQDRLVLPATFAVVDDLAAQQGTAGTAGVQLKETMTSANIAAQTGSVVSALENVASGANTLGAGALAGMNGIGTVIQNTGNSVMIQNSTILNVAVQ